MKPALARIGTKTLLVFILLITFILCIKQVIPFKSVDETMISGFVWDLYQDPFPLNLYPPFFLYIHFLLSMVYRGLFIFLGVVSTSWEFMSTVGLQFTVEAGRILNAVLAVGLVYLVYRTGHEFYNRMVGIFAALLMAFNQLIILHAHIFKSDILVSLLITLALYLMLKFTHTGKTTFILGSAFTYGLAVATKYNVYVFVLVIVLALLLYWKKLERTKRFRVLLSLPLAAAAGFFLGAPNWLIHPVGNLKLFLEKYGFGSQSVWGPYRIYTAPQIYVKFLENVIKEFGWILLLVLLLGMILSVANRNKQDILFVFFILVYIFFFGFMGFYGDRFSLPLLSGMTILMGKTIFVDIKRLFRNRIKIWQVLMILIWLVTAGHSLSKIISNHTTFNQLKTKSKNSWAKDYRTQNGIDPSRYRVAFQHLTPKIRGGIKLNAKFKVRWSKHRDQHPHFIQAVYQSYLDHSDKSNPDSPEMDVDFSKYRPFHLIRKSRYQPWDVDFVFLYRIVDPLRAVHPPDINPLTDIPRAFCRNLHTSYIPLQPYEKNPLFFKTSNGYLHHYLYSTKPLKQADIWLFSLNKQLDLKLRINRSERRIRKKNHPRVQLIEFRNPSPKPFFRDPVYEIELRASPRDLPCYMVIFPKTDSTAAVTEIPVKSTRETTRGTIPELFSEEPCPGWVREFYRRTGIDLTLLTFVNSLNLYVNPEHIPGDIHLDFIPVSAGTHTIQLTGNRLFPGSPAGSSAILLCRIHSTKGIHEKKFPLTHPFPALSIQTTEPVSFMDITVSGMRNSNLLIERITMVPDYRTFVESGWRPTFFK
jgi:hypothetical protein